MMFNDFANGEFLLRNARPALGFHFKARQRAGWKKANRDAQIERGLAGLLEPILQGTAIGTIRLGLHFERELEHCLASIKLDPVLSNIRTRADNFLDEARVNINASNNDHVIRAAQDSAFQR